MKLGRKLALARGLLFAAAVLVAPALTLAQAPPRVPPPATTVPAAPMAVDLMSGLAELKGLRVEDVAIRGNTQVSTAVIRNIIRTRVGEPLDPATTAEDYQAIYRMRKFANVEVKFERTPTGVNVVFIVTEQRQIKAVHFKGAIKVEETSLRQAIDIREGDAIDSFRISIARGAVEGVYREKNYALAHVTVDEDALAKTGELVFKVVEGPSVRVRNIRFLGAEHFADKLDSQIKSATYLFIFRGGKYSPETVEEDVAAIRRFYEGKGFFDVRVGRKIIWSPDQTELQIDFLIDEGPRYTIEKVSFQRGSGDTTTSVVSLSVPEAELRANMKGLEGVPYDAELVQRDTREIIRAYSKQFGFIYAPGSNDPDYLRIDTKPVFRKEPGKVELVYLIREGREFDLGNIFIRGNNKSQDKLIYRAFRDWTPGERFNSSEMQDAAERLRRLPYFQTVNVTPIGDERNVRDLLVEVTERKTASFNIGAGVNSNGGIAGNLVYEQTNFDIANWPASPSDIFTERAFTGAGQNFKAAFEPGTVQTSAYLRFSEPYVFDQPFSFTDELYLRNRIREGYDDRRIGTTVSFAHRFTYHLLGGISFRAEQVKIHHIEDPELRAPEILAAEGFHTLTSVGLNLRYDTTNPGLLLSDGSVTTLRWEGYGLLGGEYDFNKYTLSYEKYFTVSEDLLDRKTILAFRGNVGYLAGSTPFFERFYAGGIGSLRGFRFRGVSPRSGRDEDPIGGDFILTGTLEASFPLIGDSLRGVVFTDVGTVEPDVRLGTVRTSVGAGVRILLPFLGQVPLAIDFAFPMVKDDQDDTQVISFSFGFSQ